MGVFHTSALDNNNNNSSRTATATIAGLGRRHRHRHHHRHRHRPDATLRHLLNSIFALPENPHQRGPSRLLPESQTGRGQSTAHADWQHPDPHNRPQDDDPRRPSIGSAADAVSAPPTP